MFSKNSIDTAIVAFEFMLRTHIKHGNITKDDVKAIRNDILNMDEKKFNEIVNEYRTKVEKQLTTVLDSIPKKPGSMLN